MQLRPHILTVSTTAITRDPRGGGLNGKEAPHDSRVQGQGLRPPSWARGHCLSLCPHMILPLCVSVSQQPLLQGQRSCWIRATPWPRFNSVASTKAPSPNAVVSSGAGGAVFSLRVWALTVWSFSFGNLETHPHPPAASHSVIAACRAALFMFKGSRERVVTPPGVPSHPHLRPRLLM